MSDELVSSEIGGDILAALAAAIHAHAADLSAIDGAIGDGDHGVNLDKGFASASSRVGPDPISVADALRSIGDTLLQDIGGAMGPLYGMFFLEMADACRGLQEIDAVTFERMLDRGVSAVLELGGARVGDKTMVDVFVPARDAFSKSLESGADFRKALERMVEAAEEGKESTRGLVARVGRASRLGDRSQGVLDPGATSCALILTVLAETIRAAIRTSSSNLGGDGEGAMTTAALDGSTVG